MGNHSLMNDLPRTPERRKCSFDVMANILDGIPGGSVLDGLDDWPRSATRTEWFRITRELVASTIAQMDLPAHELAQVEEAFIGAGLL